MIVHSRGCLHLVRSCYMREFVTLRTWCLLPSGRHNASHCKRSTCSHITSHSWVLGYTAQIAQFTLRADLRDRSYQRLFLAPIRCTYVPCDWVRVIFMSAPGYMAQSAKMDRWACRSKWSAVLWAVFHFCSWRAVCKLRVHTLSEGARNRLTQSSDYDKGKSLVGLVGWLGWCRGCVDEWW